MRKQLKIEPGSKILMNCLTCHSKTKMQQFRVVDSENRTPERIPFNFGNHESHSILACLDCCIEFVAHELNSGRASLLNYYLR